MFLVRQSTMQDLGSLAKLARTVFFINLPPNDRLIAERIEQSQRSFRKLAKRGETVVARSRKKATAEPGKEDREKQSQIAADKQAVRPTEKSRSGSAYAGRSDMFMFSVLDLTSEGAPSVIGTSQLMSHMGGPGDPNWGMRVREKTFYNKSLRFGTTHTVGQLEGDESGPTELGGLILDPGFRGNKLRPGRLISFVRFHLIGLFRDLFAERVLAEMSGPVSSDGDNAFWDAFGRKFVPVKYGEADRFCQHNRDFIYDLLPKEEIYLTLLPMEVVNAVGVVGPETRPAQKLLENLGFQYKGVVDPFDGGPHMEAVTSEISLVKATRRGIVGKPLTATKLAIRAIISTLNRDGDFAAVECNAEIPTDPKDPVRIEQAAMQALGLQPGEAIGLTPLPERKHPVHESAEHTAAPRSTKQLATKTTKHPAKVKAKTKA
jgi:arginine N-succinyltransferase